MMPSLAEPRGDCVCCGSAQLFAFRGEDFFRNVIGRDLAIDRGDGRRDHLFSDRLREIRVNVAQALRIEPIAHADGEPDVQSFASLHEQDFSVRRRGLCG